MRSFVHKLLKMIACAGFLATIVTWWIKEDGQC